MFFREKFNAAIVSIRRAGATLHGKMGDVVLRAGDELLFDCGDSFDQRAPVVVANLTDVSAVESAAGQEFMVAFEVLSALPPCSVAMMKFLVSIPGRITAEPTS